MEPDIACLEVDEVIEYNILALGIIRAKKADQHQVLSRQKISSALEECRKAEGSVYYKAAVLMRALASAHAFASGNRRTAFIASKEFVRRNRGKFSIPDDPHYAKVLGKVREGKYSNYEIAEWIANGKIRQI